MKKLNAPQEIIDKYLKGDLTGLLTNCMNSSVVSQQYGKQGDLQSGVQEYNIVNQNPTNNITIGDINVNNPVGNSDDLAKELMNGLPNAFMKRMYSNLKR